MLSQINGIVLGDSGLKRITFEAEFGQPKLGLMERLLVFSEGSPPFEEGFRQLPTLFAQGEEFGWPIPELHRDEVLRAEEVGETGAAFEQVKRRFSPTREVGADATFEGIDFDVL